LFGDVNNNPYLCIVELVITDHQRVDLFVGGERVDSILLYILYKEQYSPYLLLIY